MKRSLLFFGFLSIIVNYIACGVDKKQTISAKEVFPVNKTEEQWAQELGKEKFRILRQKGTEAPFTGKYNDFKEKGIFVCGGCGAKLFSSEAKYNSGSGWPSFYQSIDKTAIKEIQDYSHGMNRIELVCANCGGHLGHVFEDGPQPTGLRYCINSLSLDFKAKE